MEQQGRIAHIGDLLASHGIWTQRLREHRNQLLSHHRTRERDRALLHCDKDIRRAGKLQRSLERALRNEQKQQSSSGLVPES